LSELDGTGKALYSWGGFLSQQPDRRFIMKLQVVFHEAEEGGYWTEVPAIPGCATQGDTFEELLQNLYEAVEGCLSVSMQPSADR